MSFVHNATAKSCPCCSIIPPYVLKGMEQSGDPTLRQSAIETRVLINEQRAIRASIVRNTPSARRVLTSAVASPMRRRIFDCKMTKDVSLQLAREEGAAAIADKAVNEAYEHSGTTWKFFKEVFDRNSVDADGMTLVSSVHYRKRYANAVWDGRQMIYGDGDGEAFDRFTKSLDVVGHELSHGVTQFEAGLEYANQSGALNEHFSDVFGVLVRQWKHKDNDPSGADWSVGRELLLPVVNAKGLRVMDQPGTAFNHALLGGKDPQPAHMRDFVVLPNTEDGDWGGVHYNSGIANRAFVLTAQAIGKPAWEIAGAIWYRTLTDRLKPMSDFLACALETVSVARDGFGDEVATKVAQAWIDVGVVKPGVGPLASLKVKAGTKAAKKASKPV